MTTTGEPAAAGEALLEREFVRGLRVIGELGFELGVVRLAAAGGSISPLLATAVLPPVLEATLADLEWRLRGGIVLLLKELTSDAIVIGGGDLLAVGEWCSS